MCSRCVNGIPAYLCRQTDRGGCHLPGAQVPGDKAGMDLGGAFSPLCVEPCPTQEAWAHSPLGTGTRTVPRTGQRQQEAEQGGCHLVTGGVWSPEQEQPELARPGRLVRAPFASTAQRRWGQSEAMPPSQDSSFPQSPRASRLPDRRSRAPMRLPDTESGSTPRRKPGHCEPASLGCHRATHSPGAVSTYSGHQCGNCWYRRHGQPRLPRFVPGTWRARQHIVFS